MSETRDRIVNAARELFWENGYDSTSLAAIQTKAEVHGGSLYFFFKAKEELLVAVLELYLEQLWPEVIAPAFATTDDPIERVFAVLHGYREMLVQTDCRGGCPIGNLAIELPDAGPAVRELIDANFSQWCQALQDELDRSDRLGAVDTGQLARLVLTVMEGGILQARGRRSVAPYDEAVAQLRQYFETLTTNDKESSR